MRWSIAACVVLIGSVAVPVAAQEVDGIVRQALLRLAQGKRDSLAAALPELLRRYPNEPGVLLLQARLLSDAQQALPLYERILREHPKSIWADDALCSIVQLSALQRDTARAWQGLRTFLQRYPSSDLLFYAWETVRATVGLPPELAPTPAKQPPSVARSAHGYAVQIASFRARQAAEQELERLRRRRFRASVVVKQLGGETYYAVVVGNYPTREAAQQALPRVAQYCRCQPVVIELP